MAIEAVGGTEPVAFAPRTEEPEEVVAVTTLGNYSPTLKLVSNQELTGGLARLLRGKSWTNPAPTYKISSESCHSVSPLAPGVIGESRAQESPNMLFTGRELSDVLGRSGNEIELRNQYGRCCRVVSGDEAMGLDPDLFVGIGNLRRIRFLRPREFRTILNAGSQTTERE